MVGMHCDSHSSEFTLTINLSVIERRVLNTEYDLNVRSNLTIAQYSKHLL